MQDCRQTYGRIYKELRIYPLVFSITEGVFFMQSEDETVGVDPAGSKMRITYQTFDREIAERTLAGCPRTIKKWEDNLRELENMGDYVAFPSFRAEFGLEDAIEVCSFLARKMGSSELKHLN